MEQTQCGTEVLSPAIHKNQSVNNLWVSLGRFSPVNQEMNAALGDSLVAAL